MPDRAPRTEYSVTEHWELLSRVTGVAGTREQIRDEVKRCLAIGKPCPGFFMAVGNHIPPNTPVENTLYYGDVCRKLCRR
jgi:uroporphyrinogen-III decarboxylase